MLNTTNNKVLIVDDSKASCLVLQKILNKYSYECFFEKDSENVMQSVREHNPSLILLDFEMPVLRGPDVCKILRTDPKTKDIPVIFVTSHTDDSKIEEAFDSGADDYVIKPVREKELLPRMSRILMNIQLQQKIQSQYQEQVTLTRVISHDLNNYLTIVNFSLGQFSDFMNSLGEPKDESKYDAIRKILNRSQSSLGRVFSLIKNVKEIQYLDDSSHSLSLQSLNALAVINECHDLFTERLLEKSIHFELQCESHVQILADHDSLTMSVLNNLISNAIKFTHKKGRIIVKAESLNDSVKIIIQDNGIGMNAQLISHIFSKSIKTSRPGTENERGTGFGMPIVKRYMEHYGGSIHVESKSIEEFPQDSGTTTTLIFKKA